MSERNPQSKSFIETNSAHSNGRVLVVEDSHPNRMVLVLLLKKLGFEVVEFVDGRGAWNALQLPENASVAAVISDLMMPEMDGLELLRRVRNDNSFSKLPFVLVTAVSDRDYLNEANSLQVNGYILKPVTYQRIFAKMSELFPEKTFPNLPV